MLLCACAAVCVDVYVYVCLCVYLWLCICDCVIVGMFVFASVCNASVCSFACIKLNECNTSHHSPCEFYFMCWYCNCFGSFFTLFYLSCLQKFFFRFFLHFVLSTGAGRGGGLYSSGAERWPWDNEDAEISSDNRITTTAVTRWSACHWSNMIKCSYEHMTRFLRSASYAKDQI